MILSDDSQRTPPLVPAPRQSSVGATVVRDLRIDVLLPIDLDFEPDVERLAAEDQTVARVQPGPGGAPAVEMPRVSLARVELDGQVIAAEAKVAARIYRFGTAIVRVTFQRDEWDLASLARVSAVTEQIRADGRTLCEIASAIGDEIRAKLRPYATSTYDMRLPVTEAYPLFRIGALPDRCPRGDAFVETERRAITAITGLPGRAAARLSAFAFETAPVRNLGPLDEDVVVVREAGAVLYVAPGPRGGDVARATEDARLISGLVELAYAQYWSLRSVDELTQHLQQQAYQFIAKLQESGGVVPLREVLKRLYRAREEHMGVTALVDDFLELPAIGYDVYLDAIFREVQSVFGVVERSKLAQERLEDLEQSFEVSHQIVSERRLLAIELLVLFVIVIELVIAIFGWHT